jgi:hypothetical protein
LECGGLPPYTFAQAAEIRPEASEAGHSAVELKEFVRGRSRRLSQRNVPFTGHLFDLPTLQESVLINNKIASGTCGRRHKESFTSHPAGCVSDPKTKLAISKHVMLGYPQRRVESGVCQIQHPGELHPCYDMVPWPEFWELTVDPRSPPPYLFNCRAFVQRRIKCPVKAFSIPSTASEVAANRFQKSIIRLVDPMHDAVEGPWLGTLERTV